MADYAIGVDLGGTNLRAAAIDNNGVLIDQISGTTDYEEGRIAVVTDMVQAIQQLKERYKDQRLVGVGIGVPGFILIEKGIIVGSHNLPGFENFPVRDEIEKQLGTTVILENDANAAALGEKWMGAGRDFNDLVLFTLGTGIGGGIISGGRIIHGQVGMAGELGHITVYPDGNPCACGNNGCLEKHASGTYIASMARLLSLGDDLTPLDVYNLAIEGNDRAKMIFRHMGCALGIALATVINLFNFPLYLLSGGVLAAWDQFAPSMLTEVKNRSFTFRNATTMIGKATLGNKAGLYGAAYLPLQQAVVR